MLGFNYLKKTIRAITFELIWHSSKAQSPETTARDGTTHPPPFPSSFLPTLLFSQDWNSHLHCCHPRNNVRKGCHCVFLWWQVWEVTVHEIQWEGIGEGREEVFCLFLEFIGLGVIFTLALLSSLPCQLRPPSAGHMTCIGQQITLSELHHNALLFPYSFLPEKHIWANTYTH